MNYPSGIVKSKSNNIFYDNRGMNLEHDINEANKYYLLNNIAIVHKKPTPITIVDVNYPNRREAVITKAYFKIASTTDYNGIYKGKYLDFEAKETKNKTNFPLFNIHAHQIEHLKKIVEHGGIGFIIVGFTSLNKLYLLEYKKLEEFIKTKNKKSIPVSFFENNGFSIEYKYNPRIDYLKVIDDIYFKER